MGELEDIVTRERSDAAAVLAPVCEPQDACPIASAR